jgi:hypothetical protein
MPDQNAVSAAVTRLSAKDDESLELLLGMRAQAIEENPVLKEDVDFLPEYDSTTMGALDTVKSLGRRLLTRWNKELYGLVCGDKPEDAEERNKIMTALNISAGAAAAAIAMSLTTLAVPAALAVVAAPILVKRLVVPGKEEMCAAWLEDINSTV